ncbi:hypothetical protein G6F58_013657 [Rhizopus delemar]|nr:hypothetical protein G6F58_013657 [Rhizopus delemar]
MHLPAPVACSGNRRAFNRARPFAHLAGLSVPGSTVVVDQGLSMVHVFSLPGGRQSRSWKAGLAKHSPRKSRNRRMIAGCWRRDAYTA